MGFFVVTTSTQPATVIACITPRGLSGLLTGCTFTDARRSVSPAIADHEPA